MANPLAILASFFLTLVDYGPQTTDYRRGPLAELKLGPTYWSAVCSLQSEVWSPKSEVRSLKSEVWSPKSGVRLPSDREMDAAVQRERLAGSPHGRPTDVVVHIKEI